MLEARAVTAVYGSLTALSDIDLRFEPGSRVGLFGHNGAGKTKHGVLAALTNEGLGV